MLSRFSLPLHLDHLFWLASFKALKGTFHALQFLSFAKPWIITFSQFFLRCISSFLFIAHNIILKIDKVKFLEIACIWIKRDSMMDELKTFSP